MQGIVLKNTENECVFHFCLFKYYNFLFPPFYMHPISLWKITHDSRNKLRRHMASYHIGKQFVQCTICQISVTRKYLRQHYKTHSDFKPFTCSLCGKFETCFIRLHWLQNTKCIFDICSTGKGFKFNAKLKVRGGLVYSFNLINLFHINN